MDYGYLCTVESSRSFRTADGTEIKSLPELSVKLARNGAGFFFEHVSDGKNDFANWVEHVVGDSELSAQLRSTKDYSQALYMINARITNLLQLAGLGSHMSVPAMSDLARAVFCNRPDGGIGMESESSAEVMKNQFQAVPEENQVKIDSSIYTNMSPDEECASLLGRLDEQVRNFEHILDQEFSKNPYVTDQVMKLSERIISKFSFMRPH